MSRHGPAHRSGRNPARLGVAAVLGLAGLLFVTTPATARGSGQRTLPGPDLVDLVRSAQQHNGELQAASSRLRAQVHALTAAALHRGDATAGDGADLAAEAAELSPHTGPGITVTLDDAPPGAFARHYPGLSGPAPDDLIVHQQDVQAVVNALWAGGARAVRLMDQRLISTSAVRCVGNVLILQGQVYSPPYVVTAVGDAERMSESLGGAKGVVLFREYAHAYGLGFDIERHDRVTVAGFAGSLDLRYARPQ